MAEDEASVFDPSLKKKKKKKKTPFDLDSASSSAIEGHKDEAGDEAAAGADEDEASGVADIDLELGKKKKKASSKKIKDDDEDEAAAGPSAPGQGDGSSAPDAPDVDVDDLEFGKKKKKKKTRDINLDDLEEALPDKGVEEEDAADDLDLESFGKKKKKKKRGVGEADGLLADEGQDADDDKENEGDSNPWTGSDRDYTYDELLQRVFSIMRDKNPEMVAGDKRFVMKPPQVVRVGTKKTAFVNFAEMAKILHRQPKHLLAFLSAELGTVGAIDGNSQLIMKGRFQQKHIENVLRRYIKEYVTCHTCRSPDTILNKETRLFFLQCMTCHSRCSVQSIKTGFQAVTSKRSVMRAKQ